MRPDTQARWLTFAAGLFLGAITTIGAVLGIAANAGS